MPERSHPRPSNPSWVPSIALLSPHSIMDPALSPQQSSDSSPLSTHLDHLRCTALSKTQIWSWHSSVFNPLMVFRITFGLLSIIWLLPTLQPSSCPTIFQSPLTFQVTQTAGQLRGLKWGLCSEIASVQAFTPPLLAARPWEKMTACPCLRDLNFVKGAIRALSTGL